MSEKSNLPKTTCIKLCMYFKQLIPPLYHDNDFLEYVKECLISKEVASGQIISIPISDHKIDFKILECIPNPSIVDEKTIVQLMNKEHPVPPTPAQLPHTLSIEKIVAEQIRRASESASQDEFIFAANVRILLSMMPQQKREELRNQMDEYTSTTERWEYKYFCGVHIGTIEKPVNGSPIKVEEETIDWHKLFELILKAFEDIGFTWKSDGRDWFST